MNPNINRQQRDKVTQWANTFFLLFLFFSCLFFLDSLVTNSFFFSFSARLLFLFLSFPAWSAAFFSSYFWSGVFPLFLVSSTAFSFFFSWRPCVDSCVFSFSLFFFLGAPHFFFFLFSVLSFFFSLFLFFWVPCVFSLSFHRLNKPLEIDTHVLSLVVSLITLSYHTHDTDMPSSGTKYVSMLHSQIRLRVKRTSNVHKDRT